MKKKCNKCKEFKEFKEFTKSKTGKYGIRSVCKICRNLHAKDNYIKNKDKRKAYRIKNKDKIKIREKIYYEKNKDRINLQNKISGKAHKDYLRNKANKYYIKNKEKIKEQQNKYRKENKEKIKESVKIYRAKTKDKIRVKNRIYRKDRCLADPVFKLNRNISNQIWHSLNGNKAGRHWEDLVGFTLNELKKHLKKQFKNGMTWENYGRNGWHIDHKIPKSVFNYTKPEHEDFKKCWALKNLQPLWESENISKSNKIINHFQPSLLI